jgi:glycosyltransferase involved in cell wall biosynthesis
MRASLVVPSRGGAGRLPALLDCLAMQSHPDWEAVVVLDGDVDDSEAVLRGAARRLPVTPVVLPENRGRSAALNAGFAVATGGVLVRCDDDLRPAPDYLARHVAHHVGRAADDPVGVVGLYLNRFPETAYARWYGRDWDQRYRRDAYRAGPDEAWRYWAGNVSVTRETFDRVGGYDPGFREYGWEDVDWGHRLHLAGVQVLLDPGLETVHAIAATTTADRALRAYYSGSARCRFEQKHGLAPGGTGPGAWSRAVDLLAGRLDEQRSRRLGSVLDRRLGLLPPPTRRRAIALLVEAAARAGHRRRDAGGAA